MLKIVPNIHLMYIIFCGLPTSQNTLNGSMRKRERWLVLHHHFCLLWDKKMIQFHFKGFFGVGFLFHKAYKPNVMVMARFMHLFRFYLFRSIVSTLSPSSKCQIQLTNHLYQIQTSLFIFQEHFLFDLASLR